MKNLNLKHIALRFVLAVAYILVVYYNLTYVRLPEPKVAKRFGGKAEYLTILNLIFLTGSLGFSFLCEFLPKSPNIIAIHKLKGIFNAASATLSLFVGLAFWSIYAIDRELVFPAVLDSIIPPWHNHAIHSTIVPVSLLSYALTSRSHSPRFTTLMVTASGLVVAYVAWIHVIHHTTGRWVYPILAVLSAPVRVLFIAGCALSSVPFAYAVHASKAWLDGKSKQPQQQEQRGARRKAKARKAY